MNDTYYTDRERWEMEQYKEMIEAEEEYYSNLRESERKKFIEWVMGMIGR